MYLPQTDNELRNQNSPLLFSLSDNKQAGQGRAGLHRIRGHGNIS